MDAQDDLRNLLPPTPGAPQLYRIGKKLLAHVGSIPINPRGVVNVFRDMTIADRFMTAKYQPHQGAKECARRLKQRGVTAP